MNAVFGEDEVDGEFVVIPTTLTVEGMNQSMPFSMREEDGQWRLDMSATMERLMGFSPEEMLESMGEAMAESMGAIGDAMSEGMGAIGDAISESFDSTGETGSSEWVVPIFTAPENGEQGMQLLRRVGRYFDPPFAPVEEELERTVTDFEGGSAVQARYGDVSAGFFVQESENAEDFRSVTVIAHGLPEGCDLQLQYLRVSADDQDAGNTATVRATAPEITRRAIGAFLGGLYGIDDV
jgi:hypothetical protein